MTTTPRAPATFPLWRRIDECLANLKTARAVGARLRKPSPTRAAGAGLDGDAECGVPGTHAPGTQAAALYRLEPTMPPVTLKDVKPTTSQ